MQGMFIYRTESMNAAYQNLRTGICSYMYVCCHHLTILFRAAKVAGTEMNAIITPTTKGLRESLRAEGWLISSNFCLKVCLIF